MRNTQLMKTQTFRTLTVCCTGRAIVLSYKGKCDHFFNQGTDELLLLSKLKKTRNRRGEGNGIRKRGRRRREGAGRGRGGRDHIQLKRQGNASWRRQHLSWTLTKEYDSKGWR